MRQSSWSWSAVLLTVFTACAGRESARPALTPAAPSGKESLICDALTGRFIGLPADGKSSGSAPSAGRWWVRSCDFGREGEELFLRVAGPAWSWVDRNDPPFHLHDNVYFHVDAELRGRIGTRIGLKDGVVSLWFRANRAKVEVEPVGSVHPSSANLGVSILRRLAAPIPAWNVDTRASSQLDAEVTERFRAALSRGFTMVYDIAGEQADFGLGLLPEGVVPEHPFADGRSWLTNELVVATPGAAHVFGPFTPEAPLTLDAQITSGAGLSFRTACASNVERGFASIERGEPGQVATVDVLSAGTLAGRGVRHANLARPACPFYLIVAPLGASLSRAAIRVRYS